VCNPGLQGPTDESTGKFPISEYAKKIGLKIHKPTCYKHCGMSDKYRLAAHLKMSYPSAVHTRPPVPFGQGFTPAFKLGPMNMNMNMDMSPNFGMNTVLSGGSSSSSSSNPVVQLGGNIAVMAGRRSGTQLMTDMFEFALNDLKQRGKTLKQSSIDQVEKYLKNMFECEKKLHKIICNMVKYSHFMSGSRGGPTQAVSLDDIEKCAEKYASTSSRYYDTQDLFVKVLTQLQKLSDSDSGTPIGQMRKAC